MSPRGMGHATLAVLQAVADRHRYGFDIIERTRLPSGTVYPALASLSRRGLVRSAWEDERVAHSQGRPRRRYYEITGSGQAALETARMKLRELGLAGPGVSGSEATS
jgi:PadR family transcriptional regulator PadR